MHATVTVLEFTSEADHDDAIAGLSELLQDATQIPGFVDCWVSDTGPLESTMFALYRDEEAAGAGGQRMRPRLGEILGPHVAGKPKRSAGTVVASSNRAHTGDSA